MVSEQASTAASQPLVSVAGISKHFGEGETRVDALRDVALDVYPGEVVALRGPSGSGKTTLLNVIGCIDAPSEGRLFINGQNVTQWSSNQLADLRAHCIGFIFQTFNLLPVLSAAENVEYPLLYRKDVSKKERQQRVKFFLDMVGLSKYASHRPGQMSGGQRQRVAIARALAIKPAIILADEPTANLDRATGTEILQLMKEINRKLGTTFIFSTHDQRVIDMADRLVRIEDGVLRELGVRRGDQWATVRLHSAEESAMSRALVDVTEKEGVHG